MTKRERELIEHALGGSKRYKPREMFPYNCYHVTDLGQAQI